MTKDNVENDISEVIELLRNGALRGGDLTIPAEKVPAVLRIVEFEVEIVKRAKFDRSISIIFERFSGGVVKLSAVITAAFFIVSFFWDTLIEILRGALIP